MKIMKALGVAGVGTGLVLGGVSLAFGWTPEWGNSVGGWVDNLGNPLGGWTQGAPNALPVPYGPNVVKKVRPPAVAGSWYPADPETLGEKVDGLLAEAKAPDLGEAPLRALLAPHAGYMFSGAPAASAFKALRGRTYRRVIVIGPSHRRHFTGLALPEATHFATPLGEIPLDMEAMRRLKELPLFPVGNAAHAQEHSVEMMLPFLQRVLEPGWKMIPLVMGEMTPEEYVQAAEALRPLAGEKTLLVLSGDFTHYGPNYSYMPYPNNEQLPDKLRTLDLGAFDLFAQGDGAGLLAYARRTGISACALGPMLLLAPLLGEEFRVQLLDYRTSGGLTGDYANSVSYVAAAVTGARPFAPLKPEVQEAADLPEESLVQLHRLANRSLALAVEKGPAAVVTDQIVSAMGVSEPFKEKSGAFVTLKKDGELRGCIGTIQPVQPLYAAVVENAVNAALHDTRFTPVKAAELEGMEVEVSVLSPLTPIDGPEKFEVGRHGIVLTKHGRRAVFLPEVAPEQGWTREETLSQLSLKAGLPADAWKEGARFEVFTSRKYSAPFRKE